MTLIEPARLPEWKWPRMPDYNGFTHEERVRGWQLIHHFIANGWLAKPERCSISGAAGNVQYHCEDYYAPWSPYAISQPIHMALHRRFRQPDTWNRIRDNYVLSGDEWFCKLDARPVDLAATLRAVHGDQIADVFRGAPYPSEGFCGRQRASTGRHALSPTLQSVGK